MSISLFEIAKQGFQNQVSILSAQLKKNLYLSQLKQASEWEAIGCRVNYSFYEVTDRTEYRQSEVIKALEDFGVDYTKCQGRKWYQFWLNDDEVRTINAIKQITPARNAQ